MKKAGVKWEERIGRRLKLRDLHILLAVIQTGSMARAAQRLAISHPVVSKAISELEHIVGKRLFDRSARGVVPTIYGQALATCGSTVFDDMRQGIRQIEFLADPTVGSLRLACPESIAAGFIQAVADRFMRQYPKIVLDVVQADTVPAKYRELREREIDLVIGRIPAPLEEHDLLVENMFDEPLFVVAGANSSWSRRRSLSLADLANEPWVLPPNDSVPGILGIELFRASGLALPRASMVTLSIHLQQCLLSNERFLTLLPSSLLHFGGKRLGIKKVPVKLPPQHSAVGIVTLKDRTISPLTHHFIDFVRAMAAPLARTFQGATALRPRR
jgi:DNA-binding transcriptional LysR family regulator